MSYRHLLSVLAAAVVLNACSATSLPGTPAANDANPTQNSAVTDQRKQPVLASALLKRPLQLGRVDGQIVPLAQVLSAPDAQADFSIKLSMPAMEPAIGRLSIAPGYYYGGHDFNSYSIQYAEENIYPAASANSLLTVYNQNVKPIIAEWDADARLLESRAQVNAQHEEYIQLPGKDEPIRVKPRFVYRLASNAKKETLNVYVLDKEIRVHRMVWGEQNLDIAKVTIDSDDAIAIARKAFASKNDPAGIEVYPKADNPEAKIVYDLPEELHWSLNLNQQSQNSLRYFVNFNFQNPDAGVPQPDSEPVEIESPDGERVSIARPMIPMQAELYGSLEIDAISGEILSMNRPVIYLHYYGGGEVDPVPMPMPETMPVEPDEAPASEAAASGTNASAAAQ